MKIDQIKANPVQYAILLIALVISVFKFFGQLEFIPTEGSMLGLLSLIGLHLVSKLDSIESFNKNAAEKILQNQIIVKDEIIALANNNGFLKFNTQEEMYEYIVGKQPKIEKSIDVTYFGNSRYFNRENNSLESLEPFESIYFNNLKKIIDEGKVQVRRVVLVRDNQIFDWVKTLPNEFNKTNFLLGCYIGDSFTPYPLSIMIIDGKEVLMTYGESRSTGNNKFVATKSAAFISIVQNYFDCLLRDSYLTKDKQPNDDIWTKFTEDCKTKDWYKEITD